MMFATASSNGSFTLVDASNGETRNLSFEDYEQLMLMQAPAIEETADQLQAECVDLATSLFRDTKMHPVKLDGAPIDPVDGGSPGMQYYTYINGHTLSTTDDKRTYTSYTYIDCVEMQEQMVINENDKIMAILINTFDYAGIRTSAPTHESWQRDLYHMRNVLKEAVRLCVESV